MLTDPEQLDAVGGERLAPLAGVVDPADEQAGGAEGLVGGGDVPGVGSLLAVAANRVPTWVPYELPYVGCERRASTSASENLAGWPSWRASKGALRRRSSTRRSRRTCRERRAMAVSRWRPALLGATTILARSQRFPENELLDGFRQVTIVIDAAPLPDTHEPRRNEILELLRAERGSLFIPASVTAEID